MPSVAENKVSRNAYDGEIVISGISGCFPSSFNVKEFENNLYNGVDMTGSIETRWKRTDEGVPKLLGKVPAWESFDSTFFGVHSVQADFMDAQTRLLMEQTYKAMLDAGLNPLSLRGTKCGVYIGTCESMAESQTHEHCSTFGIVGISKSMFANRLSFYFGLNGPSMTMDAACASSLVALDLALDELRRGDIDSALVGATSSTFHPRLLQHLHGMGVVSLTGECSPFDEKADGVVRAESVAVLFLQRKADAKRIYATVVNSKCVFNGHNLQDESHPCGRTQLKLLKDFYAKTDVNNLGYFEASGTGTIVGDYVECKAIDKIICQRRKEPLLIGSVKSNCGHSDAAAGISSIVKVLLTMENNRIPPNIHIRSIRQDIDALREGRLKVVTETQPLTKPYVAVNSIAYSGVQAHVLLKQFDKEKSQPKEKYPLPRLVFWSGRTEENAHAFFDMLTEKPLDEELIALSHNAQIGGLQGMVIRSYSVMESLEKEQRSNILVKEVAHNSGIKQPLVWVFSGMGSQWTGMAKSLMQFPIFRESLEKSHKTLLPYNLNLIDVVTSDDPKTFDNIVNSFVGITAVQIALVDIARAVGLAPDFIIGHSLGELGCAYADNSFTAEQMLLASYFRGKVSLDCEKIKGSMAAIGLSYSNIKPMLPETIEVACHNNAESCTISGPFDDVAKFVAELKSKNIFAKAVACSNIAYHSRYIAHFGPKLLQLLKGIIKNPKPRSSKWISTSVPKEQWFKEQNSLSSPEYHTNNVLKSVLFEESLSFIPKNAITIEFAPHALLHSILRSALPNATHIGLTRRNAENNTINVLSGLGKLFTNGLELNVDNLYPKVQWPVSRGTPGLNSLVEFDHSKKYYVYEYSDSVAKSGISSYNVDLEDEHCYMRGHIIDEQILVPPSFYLECVWKAFSKMRSDDAQCDNINIEFENVKFLHPSAIYKKDSREFLVVIQRGTGKFEVSLSQSLVASGTVRDIIGKTQPTPLHLEEKNDKILQSKEIVYKELALRGYSYTGDFQVVEIASKNGSYAKINWQQNWVTFINGIFQTHLLSRNSHELLFPSELRILRIYPQFHKMMLDKAPIAELITSNLQKRTVCGGVELIELTCQPMSRRNVLTKNILLSYQFVPHTPAPTMTVEDCIRCCVQIICENMVKTSLNVLEIESKHSLLKQLMILINENVTFKSNFTIFHRTKGSAKEDQNGVTHIYDSLSNIAPNLLVLTTNDAVAITEQYSQRLEDYGFLLLRLSCNLENFKIPQGFVLFGVFPTGNLTFLLLHKQKNRTSSKKLEILELTSDKNLSECMQKVLELCDKNCEVILVARKQNFDGLLDMVHYFRINPKTRLVRSVLIEDESAPNFNLNLPVYQKQLQLGWAVNVYNKGQWGTYRHLLLKHSLLPMKRANHIRASIHELGDLTTLHWEDGPLKSSASEVRVVYVAVNERDILLTSGLTNQIGFKHTLGIEYSGLDIKSKKPVMGMLPQCAMSSHISEKSNLTWEVPEKWSLKDAATVPVAYLTVYYAFFAEVNIREGQSILIHSGCTDIGLAAIIVGLAYNLEIYTTVSSVEEKSFLLKQFSKLKDQNIASLLDTSFEEVVIGGTQGKGVNYVFNTLSGDKFKASLRCLGARGHFLEIGTLDIANNNEMNLGVFLKELSFHAVVIENLFSADNAAVITKQLKQHMQEDIKRGIIKPLPSKVFLAENLEQAFRAVINKNDVGKVLIQLREKENSEETVPITVHPKIYFDSELSYVLTGGLHEISMELMNWMMERGAQKFILNSQATSLNDFQQFKLSIMKNKGCQVAINTTDIRSEKGCLELLTEANKMAAVGGLFHLALAENNDKGLAKILQYLDELTRKVCTKLQHFVVLTSVICAKGLFLPKNQFIGNSAMAHIIEKRAANKLTAKLIQSNLTDDVVDTTAKIFSFIGSLDVLLNSAEAVVSSVVVRKFNDLLEKSSQAIFAKVLLAYDANSMPATMTVSEIGTDPVKLIEMKYALEREFNVFLSPLDLKNLTIEELKELCEQSKHIITDTGLTESGDDKTDLQIISLIDKQPLPLSNELSALNDKLHGVPVIVFPGICGQITKVWQRLGNALSQPAFVYQYDNEESVQNINDLVQSAYKKISKFLEDKGTKLFYVLAYSIGAAIAHDTVLLLEKAGFEGKIVFLEGSKPWAANLMYDLTKKYNIDLAKSLLEVLLSELLPNVPLKDVREGMKYKYFKESMFLYARDLLQENNCKNAISVTLFLAAILKRITMYEALPDTLTFEPLQSPVLLIKARAEQWENIDQSYGLESLAMGSVDLDIVDGNHKTILQNDTLPNIVNGFLK